MKTNAQIENRYQPDSIYKARKVKRLYAYLNSKKDLSEIIEFNEEGRKVRSVRYSASYDKRTRSQKRVEGTKSFKYDTQMRLTQIVDSIIYFNHSSSVNNEYFAYNSDGTLSNSKYYREKFKTKPYYEYYYSYKPYKLTIIQRNDSVIIYNKTEEYDNDFYVKKFYGYYLESKLKTKFVILKGDTIRWQYSDQNDMQRYEDNETTTNTFNSKGQLIRSKVKAIFMNDRLSEHELFYGYYSNGLLKNINGYVPEFFKYEFY